MYSWTLCCVIVSNYGPLKSLELLTQWQSLTSLVTWIIMVALFKNVFLCSHISHFKMSGYTFNRFSIQRRGKILEVFELPIFIEVCHLNKSWYKHISYRKVSSAWKFHIFLAHMNCVDHPVTGHEHHICAVCIFIQSEKYMSSGNVVRCQSACCY